MHIYVYIYGIYLLITIFLLTGTCQEDAELAFTLNIVTVDSNSTLLRAEMSLASKAFLTTTRPSQQEIWQNDIKCKKTYGKTLEKSYFQNKDNICQGSLRSIMAMSLWPCTALWDVLWIYCHVRHDYTGGEDYNTPSNPPDNPTMFSLRSSVCPYTGGVPYCSVDDHRLKDCLLWDRR